MKRSFLSLLLILCLLSVFACERKGGPGNSNSTGPIIVGYYGDLSGRTSNFGQSTKEGVLMAADEINKAGGINGRQIQILSEDDEGRPEKAATVGTKLIDQDKVIALLGEVASGNTLAAAPKAQSAKVPMISPSSTNPAVTQVGDYIFRVCFIDPFQGEVMAKFAANTLKAKKAAIMLDFSRTLCLYRAVKRALVFHGMARPDMAPGCPEKLDLEPEDGEHLEALIRKIYATPKPIVDKVSELIK